MGRTTRIALTPVFPEVRKQLLLGAACLASPDAVSFSRLPGWMDQVLCTLSTLFIAIHRAPNVGPMLGLFGSVFVPATFIVTYDSFRPGTRRAGAGAAASRLGSVFLLLAQFATAGVALPLYYTVYFACTRGRGRGRGRGMQAPGPEYAWTALVSTVAGMLLPSVGMDAARWAYAAVAAWQAFPVYMLGLNLALPPLLRRVVDPGARPRAPVAAMAAISCAVSIREHAGLLLGATPVRDALLPPFRGQSLGTAGHALFAADLAFAGLTIASVVALRLHRAGVGLAAAAALLLAGTLLLGPGAATMLAWAWVELRAPRGPQEDRAAQAKL